MNTLLDISNKITQCSQNDRLEIIFSLRAFLFDIPALYWIDFSNSPDYENDLKFCQNLSFVQIKKLNENNIKKINVKPIDLYLLPKNKKLQLINHIEKIFEDLEIIVVYDKLRVNPFYDDELFKFINKNITNFSTETFELYKKRNDFSNNLLAEADIQHQIYETCILLSRKNKIIDYWINIWGQTTNYKDPSLIEHLII